MRSIFPFVILAAGLSHQVMAGDVVRLSEPVATHDGHEIFGAPLTNLDQGRSLSEVIEDRAGASGKPVIIKTEIAQVCQKKGCFFIARDGDYVARVKFADYGFFIPTDAAGKDVVLHGTLELQEISSDEREHYAADLGESPGSATESSAIEYSIVATSVAIPLG